MDIEKFIKYSDAHLESSFYLFFPIDGHSPAILSGPGGILQIIDFAVGYDGKVLSGSAKGGSFFEPNELRKFAVEEENFLRITVNIDNKHGGILVENERWMRSVEEGINDEFFILVRFVPNPSYKKEAHTLFCLDEKKLTLPALHIKNMNC